jgi:two-component SAPR family response regulator
VLAFEVNAVDYILKPVTGARLAEALNRAAQKVRRRSARSGA